MVENNVRKTVFMTGDRTGDAHLGQLNRSTFGIAEAPDFLRHMGFSGETTQTTIHRFFRPIRPIRLS